MQVTDCDLGGGSVVYYYDGTTSQWAEVSGQTYNASTGCVTFTLGAASTPSLAQLSSVTFGVQDVPPSLTVPGDQSVTYHGALSLSVSASDPQANALTLSATGLPAGLSFTDNGNGTGHGHGHCDGRPGRLPGYLHGRRRRGQHHVAPDDHHRDQGGYDAGLQRRVPHRQQPPGDAERRPRGGRGQPARRRTARRSP